MEATAQLTDIAVFVRVVEAGGFTAAGRRLGVSQPVVSRRVTELETRLGVRLLHRTTRRIHLTEAGAELFQRARRGLLEIADAELEVARRQAEPRGTLRLSAPTALAVQHLAPLFQRFSARYPAVTLDVQLDDQHVDIVEQGFDLAIRVGRLGDSDLVAQRLAPVQVVVCASPAYLERRGTPRDPQDLLQHDCIVYTYGRSPGRWTFRGRDGKPIVVPVGGTIRTNNGMLEQALAIAGHGILILPTFYVADDLRAGRLVSLLRETPPLEVGLYAVYGARKGLSAKSRAFIDALRRHVGSRPYWEKGLDALA